MSRARREPARDVLEIDWPFFGELCRALAVHVARDYDPEVIVGIAKAGVIPAAIIATMLQRDLAIITITRVRGEDEPTLLSAPPESVRGRRVLLVDETCDSGNTLKLAAHALKDMRPGDVRTAVSFQTGKWQPDFHAFVTAKGIVLPWDREMVDQGALVRK